MADETTNPDVQEVADVQDENTAQDTPELDEDGNPVEPEPEDDSEEIERDGKKYRIPKFAKSEMMMHADYTRKTQELAEQRRNVEQRATAYNEASEAERQATVNLGIVDAQLQHYNRIDWKQWLEVDPTEAQKAWMDFQQLQGSRGEHEKQIAQARSTRETEAQRISAERMQLAAAELSRETWWKPERATALVDFGQKQYGLSKADLDAIDDPRLIRVLNDAFEHRQAASKQQIQRKAETVQKVEPAAKPRGASPQRGPSDNDDIDTWMAKERARVSRKKD
jgi:hypothetical protein